VEIAIKVSLGKLDVSFDNLLGELERVGFIILQTESIYLRRLMDLPQIHRDPFDRLIVATAVVEDMVLISADENVHKYSVTWVW
jgi:PIN domain nuclease of toxin-antitoxin system